MTYASLGICGRAAFLRGIATRGCKDSRPDTVASLDLWRGADDVDR